MTAAAAVQADHRELLLRACAAYNSQDIEALVARFSDDVDRPDDAGSLRGNDEVRAYWTELWAGYECDPEIHRAPLTLACAVMCSRRLNSP